MNDDPYRRSNQPSNELARLAQQGQARLDAAYQGQGASAHAAADRNLRTAIGPVRGAPWKTLVLVLLVLSLPVAVGGIVATTAIDIKLMPIGMTGLFAAFGLLAVYLTMAPLATPAGVEAERAWAASLPFALDSYFDVLATEPVAECSLTVEVHWASQGVDRATLQGIVALLDTRARVVEVYGSHASFTTGPISGMTGIRINRRSVVRNHRLGKAVHRLVDVVLLPIHRNAPLARVRLSRGL